MRHNFGAKPYCYPQPVFILAAYDQNGKPCAMNAAWGGISEEDQVSICLSEFHKTVKNIMETKAFTISMATVSQVQACDYVGIATGNKTENKMEIAGFTTIKSEFVNAPIIEQLPLAMECELIDYDTESCIMRGRIINVSADESVIKDGNIDVNALEPIVFDPFHNCYRRVGESIAKAFSVGKNLLK